MTLPFGDRAVGQPVLACDPVDLEFDVVDEEPPLPEFVEELDEPPLPVFAQETDEIAGAEVGVELEPPARG